MNIFTQTERGECRSSGNIRTKLVRHSNNEWIDGGKQKDIDFCVSYCLPVSIWDGSTFFGGCEDESHISVCKFYCKASKVPTMEQNKVASILLTIPRCTAGLKRLYCSIFGSLDTKLDF